MFRVYKEWKGADRESKRNTRVWEDDNREHIGRGKKLNDNKKNGENDLKTEEGGLKEEKESDTLREMKT